MLTKWKEGVLENGKAYSREERGLSWVCGRCSNPGNGRLRQVVELDFLPSGISWGAFENSNT